MFDTHQYEHHTHKHIQSSPSTIKVTEQRAPTDESVRLLREMEAAAASKRIAEFKLDNNLFSAHVEVSTHLQDYKLLAVAVFDMNGKRYHANAVVDVDTVDAKNKLATLLKENIAEKVASVILKDAFSQQGNQFFFR